MKLTLSLQRSLTFQVVAYSISYFKAGSFLSLSKLLTEGYSSHKLTVIFFWFLYTLVRTKIGPFATPDVIQNAPGLPKTRSGKIMRRVLRQVAKNEKKIGDVTTMADSSVLKNLFENRPDVDFLL